MPLYFYIPLLILQVLYFYLPAAVANMAPVLFKWIPFGDRPLDFGKKWRGQRIFGDHKTMRGLAAGILSAVLILYIQKKFLIDINHEIAPISYFDFSSILLGFLFGFGALAGDLLKSFFKRQLNIPEGQSWPPFDQLDWIIGANLAIALIVKVPAMMILGSFLILGLLHPLVNLLGYALKIKKNKY